MLFIIIGVVLAIVWFFVGINRDWNEKVIATGSGILIVLGLFCATAVDCGYATKELEKEIELVSLGTDVASEGVGTRLYVAVSAQKVYTYRFEKENDTGIPGQLYETRTLSGNIEELESVECKKPVLLVYNHEAKGKFWFSLFATDKKSYLFYVPEGTIAKDVVLK